MIIYFTPGSCSLQDLIKRDNFEFTPDQAVYIFSVLLDFMLLMKSIGICHSDIKLENTQLVKTYAEPNAYILKIIDFGSATYGNTSEYTACTKYYFNSPHRKYDKFQEVEFRNIEEKYRNEFY